jgi:hypothetical protein
VKFSLFGNRAFQAYEIFASTFLKAKTKKMLTLN